MIMNRITNRIFQKINESENTHITTGLIGSGVGFIFASSQYIEDKGIPPVVMPLGIVLGFAYGCFCLSPYR